MAKYVTQESEKDIRARLERIEKDWVSYREFISRHMNGEDYENIPLRKIREFYQQRFSPAECGLATLKQDIYYFLERVHKLIMDWELDLDEDVTIPQALAKAKEKQSELLKKSIG